MKRRSFLTRTTGLFSLLPLSRSDAAQSQGATRAAGGCGPASLPFRAILAGYGDPRNRTSDFWQRETWNSRLQRWSREGFNVVVWMGANELLNGRHALARLEEFPEAREMGRDENEKIIEQMKWLFARARQSGMKNFLYPVYIHYTEPFMKAHGLEKPGSASETVHYFASKGYGLPPNTVYNVGVRNETTRKYMESVVAEICKIYDDLDGFYGPMGEAVPADRSTYFKEAIIPGLRRSGRKPLYILHQWQMPLDDFMKNIVTSGYENLWLGFHAYNSEQITTPKPYSCLVEWAETTGLPTVAAVYPANVLWFPFNSPKLAWEITREMRRIPHFQGYVYWEHQGEKLSPLFREALAYYAKNDERYSDQGWLAILREQYADSEAAAHFLRAYDVSCRIQPEYCALVWCGNDVHRRELRLPYSFLTGYSHVWSWTTDRTRGQPLQPVWHYAYWAAKSPKTYLDRNGSEWRIARGTAADYRQESIWGTEGGAEYDTIPPVHMKKVREMGDECLREAELGLRTVRKNREQAEELHAFMKGYQLLTHYYEKKVLAAIAALIYSNSQRAEDKPTAEKLADETLDSYVRTATFLHERLDPVVKKLKGATMSQYEFPSVKRKDLPELIEVEKQERAQLAEIFKWPKT